MNDRWTSLKTAWTSRISLPLYRKAHRWLLKRLLPAETRVFEVQLSKRMREVELDDRNERELDDFR